MVWAIATGILRQILLVMVGAEGGTSAEIQQVSRRVALAGRLPVDVSVLFNAISNLNRFEEGIENPRVAGSIPRVAILSQNT